MQTTVVVIGGGQAGLAMSRCLALRAVDHVVLERREVAYSWRARRWDSLRLLTPNWMSRLPGHRYRGDDPDGYMTAAQVIDYLDGYRRAIGAPVHTDTTVTRVRRDASHYTVDTSNGPWRCRAVVVATGTEQTHHIPAIGEALPARLPQIPALSYRNPGQLDADRVLVVGASASGVQIADELRRTGREVTVAVGEHIRLPRTYRSRDIHRWLDAIGQADERYDAVDDIARARRLPSPQLLGSEQLRSLDLNKLAHNGVRLTGRLVGLAGRRVQFSGSLANLVASADLKQNRLLDRIDAHVDERGLADIVGLADRPCPTEIPSAPTELPIDSFDAVIWATGHRPRYPFLDPALLDRRGQVRHDGGVLAAPGMYVLGLPFTRRRKSAFLDGVGPDAWELSAHLVAYLDRSVAAA